MKHTLLFLTLPLLTFGQWYISPKIGSLKPSQSQIDTGFLPATLKSKTGEYYGVSGGYDFGKLRAELLYDYTSFMTASYTIMGKEKPYTDTIEEHALFANAIASPFELGRFKPYAGIGCGYIRNSVDLFGWQWLAGIEYRCKKNVSMTLGYIKRYTTDMDEGGWIIRNPKASICTLGINWRF